MRQNKFSTCSPSTALYRKAEPLWQLAPSTDASGAALADFMLLIPRLRSRGPGFAQHAGSVLRQVCAEFGEQVQFADLNLRTGVIWVSVRATPGLCAEVAQAIRARLPQALTVGGQLGAVPVARPRSRLWRRVMGIPQRVVRRLLPSLPESDSR